MKLLVYICLMTAMFGLGFYEGNRRNEKPVIYSGVEDITWSFPYPIKAKLTSIEVKSNILAIYDTTTGKMWEGKPEPLFMGAFRTGE